MERNCPVKPMNPGRRMEPVISLPGPRHEIHHRADNKHLRSSVQIHTERCHESSSLVSMILLEVFLLIQNSSKFWLNKMHAPRLAECLWMSQEKPADSSCTPSQAEELRICPLSWCPPSFSATRSASCPAASGSPLLVVVLTWGRWDDLSWVQVPCVPDTYL